MLEHVFDTAELLDQFDRAFISNSGSAWNIVDGISAQSHHVDDLLRRYPEYFHHFVAIEDEIVFDRVEHFDATSDQLQHVFVIRNYKDIMILLGGLTGQRADYIVGFEALGLQNGDAKGFQSPPDEWQLLRQISRHLGAVGFVAGVIDLVKGLGLDVPFAHRGHGARTLIAKDGPAHVEDSGKELRLKIAAKLVDHGHA